MGEQGPIPPPAKKTIEAILSSEALIAGKELAKKRDAKKNRIFINKKIKESLEAEIANKRKEHPSLVSTEEFEDIFIGKKIAEEIEKMLRDNPDLKSLVHKKINRITNPVKVAEIVRSEIITYYIEYFQKETEREAVFSSATIAAGKELAEKKDDQKKPIYSSDEIEQRLEMAIKNEKKKNPNFNITEKQRNGFIAREITKEIEKMLLENPNLKSLLYDPIINLTDTAKIEILTTQLVDRMILIQLRKNRLVEQGNKLAS